MAKKKKNKQAQQKTAVVCDDACQTHNSQDFVEANNDDAVHHEEQHEDDENEKTILDVAGAPVVKHKPRGPTKGKNLPSNYSSRIEVEYNQNGIPIGEGSVKLSSYLGVLVRERVPVTLDTWKNLSDELKVVLWNCVQARFNLDEEFQKILVFQHMGSLFRAAKSRAVRSILRAKNEEERVALKPDNVKDPAQWKKFIKLKKSTEFKAKSEKFQTIRRSLIPHTTGRKGMARLAEELKNKSDDPSSISRVHVWIKAHTRKDGKPVNTIAADNINKINQIERDSNSGSVTNYKLDALTQVLGADKPGRLKGMGRGMNYTKSIWSSLKDKRTIQLENTVAELVKTVQSLVKDKGQHRESWAETSTPCVIGHNSQNDICELLDWTGLDEIVAEGRVLTSNPRELVQHIPLGAKAKKVIVDIARKPDAFLWRPSISLRHIGEAQSEIIAWPSDRVVMRTINHFDNEDDASKTNNSHSKCKLLDWDDDEQIVAEGRLHSSDPDALVDGIPIGPAAMSVIVENAKKKEAFLWRPVNGLNRVGEVIGIKVAWPKSLVIVETIDQSSMIKVPSVLQVSNVNVTEKSTNLMMHGKCKLIDLSESGKVVAEGRVISTDPTTIVHFVPLGKDAVRVSIDVVHVPRACLWKTSSEFQSMGDTLGSSIAWPAANVIME